MRFVNRDEHLSHRKRHARGVGHGAQTATDRFLPALVQIVRRMGNEGVTLSHAGKLMAQREGFSRVLKEQRMTFRQFVGLFEHRFRVKTQGTASKIHMSADDVEARTREKPEGTLMQFHTPK